MKIVVPKRDIIVQPVFRNPQHLSMLARFGADFDGDGEFVHSPLDPRLISFYTDFYRQQVEGQLHARIISGKYDPAGQIDMRIQRIL